MVTSNSNKNLNGNHKNTANGNHYTKRNGNNGHLGKYSRLASMGKISVKILNKLYHPIDSTNRFLNLALTNLEEDSQSRQFLLESKTGLRKMLALLKRLNTYAKKMEKELYAITEERK